MGRLIEIAPEQPLPPSLTLRVGDLLSFAATGGHVQSGSGVVEILGPFITGLLLDDSRILSPEGTPGAVFFLARRPGRATIDVITGDPWSAPHTKTMVITVESI
ncbi:MAG: hypothetical protein QOF02_1645 [Blastocatellia bacterium]|jgi:hypothetical protein|nr:hypothetical protein [Blastocatellia bacterium]